MNMCTKLNGRDTLGVQAAVQTSGYVCSTTVVGVK